MKLIKKFISKFSFMKRKKNETKIEQNNTTNVNTTIEEDNPNQKYATIAISDDKSNSTDFFTFKDADDKELDDFVFANDLKSPGAKKEIKKKVSYRFTLKDNSNIDDIEIQQ